MDKRSKSDESSHTLVEFYDYLTVTLSCYFENAPEKVFPVCFNKKQIIAISPNLNRIGNENLWNYYSYKIQTAAGDFIVLSLSDWDEFLDQVWNTEDDEDEDFFGSESDFSDNFEEENENEKNNYE